MFNFNNKRIETKPLWIETSRLTEILNFCWPLIKKQTICQNNSVPNFLIYLHYNQKSQKDVLII